MNAFRHEKAISGVAVLALLASAFVARPAFADPHTEGVAKDALQKAGTDYSALNYAGAIARLKKAAQACGAKNCTPQTKAAVLRDLGTMQFRAGDKDGAGKSFADALALDQTLTLSPSYDASDVGAAWEDARAIAGLPAGTVSTKPAPTAAGAAPAAGGPAAPAAGAAPAAAGHGAAGHPPPEPTGEQPTGDFDHDPAPEQKEDTPLPIHVEYGGSSKLTRVVVKYKGAQMREWTRIELQHGEGNGYEGTIPCGDVMRGTMRYWVQGFDKTNEPVAASGDPKHPYYVVIRDKITSEPPHLPGKEAPKSCEETDCPPGLPGCHSKKKGEGAGDEAGGATEPGGGGEGDEKDKKKRAMQGSRWWIGATFALDFLSMPSGTNVCKRQTGGNPLNSQGYYCYDSVKGADFPSQAQNPTLSVPGAGTASGALQAGNIRALLALDYAFTPNILAGARLGYVINAYPGSDAIKAGHAFLPVHIEARATYLLGDAPLTRAGFAAMGFFGLGLSEFDGHQSTNVKVAGQTGTQVVDAWLTDAPFFVALGAGGRYQFSPRAAVTGALRLNLVVGGNGFMPTFGPEIGVLYGL